MSNCNLFYYSGIGECDAMLQKAIGVIMCDKGTSVTKANAKLLSTWQGIIAPTTSQTGIFIPFNRGYQNNTAEPEFNTSNNGYTEKTHDPAPQLIGFGKVSYCDYRTFFDADGHDKDFYFVLEDGKLWASVDSSDNFIGFRANFNVRFNAPLADNIAESFPFYMNFLSTPQLKKGCIITPSFELIELQDAQPVGLHVDVTTAWATDTVTVKVVKRCSPDEPYAGLTETTNWEVLSAKADTGVSVSVVDDTDAALGIYVLTIASLTDDVVIRGVDDDSTNLTYVTQPLTIVV